MSSKSCFARTVVDASIPVSNAAGPAELSPIAGDKVVESLENSFVGVAFSIGGQKVRNGAFTRPDNSTQASGRHPDRSDLLASRPECFVGAAVPSMLIFIKTASRPAFRV